MTPEDLAALHAIIEGRVQGVGFRAHGSEFAQSLGLKGWMRNKGDDQVEVWAEGARSDLDKLLAYLRRGPSMAYVTNLQVSYPQPEGKFTGFMVISSIG